MEDLPTQCYIIYYSVKPDQPIGRRLYYMKKFAEDGLGDGIQVLNVTILPHQQTDSCLMLVAANSKDKIIKKLQECASAFDTIIETIDNHAFSKVDQLPNFCLLTSAVQLDAPELISIPELAQSVNPVLSINGNKDNRYQHIELVHSDGLLAVKAYAAEHYPQEFAMVAPCLTFSEFLEQLENPQAKIIDESSNEINLHPTAQPCTIVNINNQSCYYNTGNRLYSIFQNVKQLGQNEQAQVSATVYLWSTLSGQYEVENSWAVNGFPSHSFSKVPSQNALPELVVPYIPGGTIHVNVAKKQFEIITETSIWLDTLLNSNQYLAPWPEDAYQGGQLKAYQYILTQIPGNTPPKNGTVKPGIIQAINFPANDDFSEEEFNQVKSHLLNETTYFQYVNDWYGINGIVNAINTQLTAVSTDNLTATAALMSISDSTSISMLLDMIMNIFASIVGVIPEAGPILSGIVRSAWAGAKFAIGTDQAFTATVGEMAGTLASYLIAVNEATGKHFNTLSNNYGNLKEFASGVMEGKLSAKDLGITVNSEWNDSSTSDGNIKLPDNYLQAAANAWTVIFYQALFAAKTTMYPTFYISSSLPSNSWDPTTENWKYTFAFKCIYLNSSNKNTNGFLTVESYCLASKVVMQNLFGPNSQLNVNPIAFYAGFDGWPTTIPNDLLTTVVSIG